VPRRLSRQLRLLPRSAPASFQPHLLLKPHRPIVLRSVVVAVSGGSILGSSTSTAFEPKLTSELEKQLEGSVLRQGDIISVSIAADGKANDVSLRVVMCEPVLQGVFRAGNATAAGASQPTSLLLVFHEEENDIDESTEQGSIAFSEDEERVSPNGVHFSSEGLHDDESSQEGDDLADDLIIDESFLSQVDALSREQILRQDPTDRSVELMQDQEMLEETLEHWSKGEERQSMESLDEESIVLLDEGGLASIGAFNGDWILASLGGLHQGDAQRLVRAFTIPPTLSYTSSSQAPKHKCARISPILFRNLLVEDTDDPAAPYPCLTLHALPSSLAHRRRSAQSSAGFNERPPIPFAESLSIARVASPVSIDKGYQTLFLESLKAYFQDKRRLVRQGDLIAVRVDTGKVRWTRKGDAHDLPSAQDKESGEDGAEGALDIFSLELPCSEPSSPSSAVVFFKIMSLMPDLESPLNEAVTTEDAVSFQSSAWTGSIGCIVDSALTKMVQTGVARCRVPDVSGWLGLSAEMPMQTNTLQGPLLEAGSPYANLCKLVSATLSPASASVDLHLTVLLKGARGSGKRTLVRRAARQLGVHLLELDCFDLVSDTEARTEGILRARFEKAADAAPAIVLLHNIEALAKKSQAMETGQEPHMTAVLRDCIKDLRLRTGSSARQRPADDMTVSDRSPHPVAVFATTCDADKSPIGILACFKHEISLEAPNEAERLEIIGNTLVDSVLSPDCSLKSLATQTAAFVPADLASLTARARQAAVERMFQSL
jgi:peroxin-6